MKKVILLLTVLFFLAPILGNAQFVKLDSVMHFDLYEGWNKKETASNYIHPIAMDMTYEFKDSTLQRTYVIGDVFPTNMMGEDTIIVLMDREINGINVKNCWSKSESGNEYYYFFIDNKFVIYMDRFGAQDDYYIRH